MKEYIYYYGQCSLLFMTLIFLNCWSQPIILSPQLNNSQWEKLSPTVTKNCLLPIFTFPVCNTWYKINKYLRYGKILHLKMFLSLFSSAVIHIFVYLFYLEPNFELCPCLIFFCFVSDGGREIRIPCNICLLFGVSVREQWSWWAKGKTNGLNELWIYLVHFIDYCFSQWAAKSENSCECKHLLPKLF